MCQLLFSTVYYMVSLFLTLWLGLACFLLYSLIPCQSGTSPLRAHATRASHLLVVCFGRWGKCSPGERLKKEPIPPCMVAREVLGSSQAQRMRRSEVSREQCEQCERLLLARILRRRVQPVLRASWFAPSRAYRRRRPPQR